MCWSEMSPSCLANNAVCIYSRTRAVGFTTRRMVRSAHLTLSIYYCSVCFCRFKWIFLRENTYCIVGTAWWADHHIKSSPKGSGLMWWLVLKWAHLAFPTMPYAYILALMLLAFTTRRMVRSAQLALSAIRFTTQFHFTVSERYSYEKIHTASLARRDGLISALITTSNPRLKAWAWCGDLCWDESIDCLSNVAICIYSSTHASKRYPHF